MALRQLAGVDTPLTPLERAVQQRSAKLLLQWEVTCDAALLQSRSSGPTAEAFAEGFHRAYLLPLEAEEAERWPEELAANQLIYLSLSAEEAVPGIGAARTHVGGSYGRETMVEGNFDVDLVVFVRGVTMDEWLQPEMGRKVRRMFARALLDVAPGEWCVQLSAPDEEAEEEGGPRYALQLRLGAVEADVLLVPDVVEDPILNDPDWVLAQHTALMREMYDNPGGASYCRLRERANSTALTTFMREQPEEVRAVARGLKAWRDGLEVDAVPNCGIGSVALEVLALAAHQQLQGQGPQEGSPALYQVRLFQAALSLLVEAVEGGRRVVTVDAGGWGPPPPRSPLDYQHCWAADPVKIIHPIDPTCNLAHQSPDKPTAQWQAVAAEAKELLDTFRSGTLGEVLGVLAPAMQLQRERAAAGLERVELGPPPVLLSVGDSSHQRPQEHAGAAVASHPQVVLSSEAVHAKHPGVLGDVMGELGPAMRLQWERAAAALERLAPVPAPVPCRT
ncbi:hypothetical protein HYH03_012290 [Edaphochlamys debaryana]|uniref:Uncharacterized protein n=1 Tax=Edaphochlamys debaryana TaxID=47281 RepID=A0A835XTA1_9CHLO|nr:hypothetical protein HYH03_012290 [Edaphochlamys debaryana]|eukprot:KAG2489270.1 hypothetical protein HYH03_012290 [Edaphochlamys debaryana]